MTIRGIIWTILLALAGILSAGVSTFWNHRRPFGVDLRQDTLLSLLYCGLPVLCFPVFLLVQPAAPRCLAAFADGAHVSWRLLRA